jgi:hypothetical protein
LFYIQNVLDASIAQGDAYWDAMAGKDYAKEQVSGDLLLG